MNLQQGWIRVFTSNSFEAQLPFPLLAIVHSHSLLDVPASEEVPLNAIFTRNGINILRVERNPFPTQAPAPVVAQTLTVPQEVPPDISSVVSSQELGMLEVGANKFKVPNVPIRSTSRREASSIVERIESYKMLKSIYETFREDKVFTGKPATFIIQPSLISPVSPPISLNGAYFIAEVMMNQIILLKAESKDFVKEVVNVISRESSDMFLHLKDELVKAEYALNEIGRAHV